MTIPKGLLADTVDTGGTAVVVAEGPLGGGFIVNPSDAPGYIFVDMVGEPGTVEIGTTVALAPGQSFGIPPLHATVVVRVNAAATQTFAGTVW